MSSVIHGKDVVLEMLISGQYYPVLCATDCSFNRSIEFTDITGPDTGTFGKILPLIESWAMNVSGLTKVENDLVLTFFYILQTGVRRQSATVRITFTDDAAASKQISGSVYFGNMSIAGGISDFATGDIEMRGDGAYSIGDTIDPPLASIDNIFGDWWPTTGGQNYIDGASSEWGYTLEAKQILGVARSHQIYDVITSGTPTNYQCKHNNITGVITFDTSIPFNAGETVWVIFKEV
jgi:hypothetical protein